MGAKFETMKGDKLNVIRGKLSTAELIPLITYN